MNRERRAVLLTVTFCIHLQKEVCTAKVVLNDKKIYDKRGEQTLLRQYAVHIIQRLLEKDRRNRLGALSYSEVLGHPFYATVKWDDLCKSHCLLPLDKYTDAYLNLKQAKHSPNSGQRGSLDAGWSPMASTESRKRKDILRVETLYGKLFNIQAPTNHSLRSLAVFAEVCGPYDFTFAVATIGLRADSTCVSCLGSAGTALRFMFGTAFFALLCFNDEPLLLLRREGNL